MAADLRIVAGCGEDGATEWKDCSQSGTFSFTGAFTLRSAADPLSLRADSPMVR